MSGAGYNDNASIYSPLFLITFRPVCSGSEATDDSFSDSDDSFSEGEEGAGARGEAARLADAFGISAPLAWTAESEARQEAANLRGENKAPGGSAIT